MSCLPSRDTKKRMTPDAWGANVANRTEQVLDKTSEIAQESSRRAAYGLPYPNPSSTRVTKAMRSNRRADTNPELLVRSALHRLGYRFRKDYLVDLKTRQVRVDIAFPREGLAVFVDGCYWHQCPEHRSIPRTNRDYWEPKLRRNMERDVKTSKVLRQAGWKVLRIWEHVPPEDAADTIAGIVERLQARMASAVQENGSKTAIDLFAGAGGSSAGLKAAGFRVLAAIESESSAAATYANNQPEVKLFECDIRKVKPKTFREALGLAPKDLTLLNACPPCQGFSTLGRGNAEDKRNDLISIVLPFVREIRPQAFVIENVPAVRYDKRLKRVIEESEKLGYDVRVYLVDAVEFGVPQTRRRLIVVGILSDNDVPFPEHIAELLPRSFRRDPLPITEVLAKAGPIRGTHDSIHRARTSTPAVFERIRSVPVNGDRFDLPQDQQLECHKALNERRNATGPYGRIRTDGPAPTLTTRCTTPSCGRFVHPTEHRGISLREAALIQTFPIGYAFSGSYQSIEAQIGNAVPVRLAEALGMAVNELLWEVKHA